MRRALLVANAAARGVDPAVLADVVAALERDFAVEVSQPGDRESFDAAVSDAARDADVVVVAGGDGTLNCAINALAHRLDELTFALLPMGTGNDLARTMGLAGDPLAVARGLAGAPTAELDVFRVAGPAGDRLFVNACMGGFPVTVNESLTEAEKRRLGPLAFAWGAAKSLSDLERWDVRVDDRRVSDCVAVGVGNGRSSGGGVEVWPDADPADGSLDVAALPAQGVADALRLAAQVRLGSHANIEGVYMSRRQEVRISADPVLEFNVDGDLVGMVTPVTFGLAGRWRLLAPK